MSKTPDGAQLLIRHLEAEGVEYVFGIPGAKIDGVFNALVDSKIKTVVCRHAERCLYRRRDRPHDGKAGVAMGLPSPPPAPECPIWSRD